jgi:hypothetical protein
MYFLVHTNFFRSKMVSELLHIYSKWYICNSKWYLQIALLPKTVHELVYYYPKWYMNYCAITQNQYSNCTSLRATRALIYPHMKIRYMTGSLKFFFSYLTKKWVLKLIGSQLFNNLHKRYWPIGYRFLYRCIGSWRSEQNVQDDDY